MKLSIIIPAHKLAPYIYECLLSVFTQRTDFDFELDVKKPPMAAVPEHLRSLCVFGIGAGGSVTALLQQRRVGHLLIFEPNPDFFYASLFQIPWHKKLDGIKDQNGIYFNIGGDGAEYYQDLIQHIQVKGSYQLTDSFYLQGYADGQLSTAINKLSRELLLLFTNNEYFDAARSILAHLRANSAQGYPFLLDSKQRKAAPINYPVFIVGNGPSLDDSLDIIRQHQGRAIVISCSTALKTLHKAGIRPDYHMEVEIQLATHSWITQIKDADYLKQITLLSVAGVHPETAKLFRDTLMVLKKDDTCYSSFHQQVKKLGLRLAEAAKTYPTVSNFALSVCAELGVSEVYLFGVDLGYKDPNQHHSKHSAYYKDDGKPVYDFGKVHGQSQPVAGNFQAEVLTSASFDYARGMMESLLDDSKRTMTVFNCSDGALIQGTVPLSADKLRLSAPDATSKKSCLDLITTRYFYPLTDAEYHKVFSVFDYAKLESQLKEIESIVNQPVESHQAAFALLSRQQDLLLRNYFSQNNLLAQLFLGETNYFSAALCKFLDFDATDKLVYFNAALAVYKEFLQQATEALRSPLAFDQADTTLFSKKP